MTGPNAGCGAGKSVMRLTGPMLTGLWDKSGLCRSREPSPGVSWYREGEGMRSVKQRCLLKCPHCEHVFHRTLDPTRGTTSCPKCQGRFSRCAAYLVGEAAAATGYWKSRVAKRVAKAAVVLADRDCDPLRAAIRGEQIPNSIPEARFKARAAAKGWIPHRPSWPDFLVEYDGGLIAVEVKSRKDEVSPTQRATFDLLEQAGIHVYLWRDQSSTLTRWRASA